MKRYFITGTDTDCGKTYVTCQLLDYFQAQGQNALAIKPLASGGDDVLRLQAHNSDKSLNINCKQYQEPTAPHIAAQKANDNLSAKVLAEFCEQQVFKRFEPLLIEGAGGLMVPLNSEETWLHFLKITKIPVIVVVAIRLGCMNHALLTAEVLRAHGIETKGWIANHIDAAMGYGEENRDYLVKKLSFPLLGVLGYGGGFKEIRYCLKPHAGWHAVSFT